MSSLTAHILAFHQCTIGGLKNGATGRLAPTDSRSQDRPCTDLRHGGKKYRFFMIKKYRISLERILPFAVFGALWYLLIKHLSDFWTLDPQYSFGWFAPVICAYLIFIRWITRPSPGPAPSRGAQWVFCIAAFAILPTWLLYHPNPLSHLFTYLLPLH